MKRYAWIMLAVFLFNPGGCFSQSDRGGTMPPAKAVR